MKQAMTIWGDIQGITGVTCEGKWDKKLENWGEWPLK